MKNANVSNSSQELTYCFWNNYGSNLKLEIACDDPYLQVHPYDLSETFGKKLVSNLYIGHIQLSSRVSWCAFDQFFQMQLSF